MYDAAKTFHHKQQLLSPKASTAMDQENKQYDFESTMPSIWHKEGPTSEYAKPEVEAGNDYNDYYEFDDDINSNTRTLRSGEVTTEEQNNYIRAK